MKFNIAAAAIAGGVGFAIALGAAGIINMFVEGYGSVFLEMMASVYPGYKATGAAGDLLIGCFYAATDGIIAGGGLALLYNVASCCGKKNNTYF
jgi:hypothetical protein